MSIIYGNMVGGASGTDGKSAYQYAQDGGYTGTEEEFAAKLAEEIPSGGGESAWETLIDTTLAEAAELDTGEVPGKTEMLCVFAVPKSDAAISLTASSKAFGAFLTYVSMAGTTYGKVGFIHALQINGHGIAFAGSGDTTSATPGMGTQPRANINVLYLLPTASANDIPLKITSALPAGTIIKVFVR